MSDSDDQPQEHSAASSRPATPTLKNKGSPRLINKKDLRRGTSYPSPLALERDRDNSLPGSMRKRIVLSKQIISVQKEDGDIGHIEVNINDEEFTQQQARILE